jgi:hypothetical protein
MIAHFSAPAHVTVLFDYHVVSKIMLDRVEAAIPSGPGILRTGLNRTVDAADTFFDRILRGEPVTANLKPAIRFGSE